GLIRLPSPGGCGRGKSAESGLLASIPDSQDLHVESSRADEGRDGKGESRPESARSGQVARLSPLCLLQSRISPGGPVGQVVRMPGRNFHVHLVSDSTGETVSSVARACLVQYEGIFVQEHVWSLVRTKGQMEKVMQEVERNRGPVLYTLVDPDLRDLVRDK